MPITTTNQIVDGFLDPNSTYPLAHQTAKEGCASCGKELGYTNLIRCVEIAPNNWELHHATCFGG